nr:immunoglobulin heavy chain junction region [Macaca mulatta]MOY21706.1 immunoglobulin heavy chain junction region [Macaca mulatta]MOY21777.1 immunoglobulin heavy chain junction region [Macaca mulatta]MOY21794.1 immunoglobulin heavy chain junction region [Macaca mulatta]MOY22090.1 immunoglobulin heavy chain junction region [Macaca mulatta]
CAKVDTATVWYAFDSW